VNRHLTTVKWHDQTNGPWLHVDSFLEYLADTKTHLLAEAKPEQTHAVKGLVALLDAISTNYITLKHNATRRRLEALAATLNVESLTHDLLDLRDELEQGPDDE
jgi:chloramphenicol 3-O-phosphotransferase